MKKITKIEMFQRVLSNLTNQDEIDFINHEIELVKAKNSSIKKPTATQQENEKLKIEIVEYLSNHTNERFTITQLTTSITSLNNLSNQRVSALLKQLVDNNKIVKTYEKRKAYFSIE